MEENNNIDDIFRSGLDDLEVTPSAGNWNAISSNLDAKRAAKVRKKRGLWFSAVALLLITSYTALQIFSTSKSKTSEKISEQTQIKKESADKSIITEENNFSTSGNNPINRPSAVENTTAGSIASTTGVIQLNKKQPSLSVENSEVEIQNRYPANSNINSKQPASVVSVVNTEPKTPGTQNDHLNSNSAKTDNTVISTAAVSSAVVIHESSQNTASPSVANKSGNNPEESNTNPAYGSNDKTAVPATTVAISRAAESTSVAPGVSGSIDPSPISENGSSETIRVNEGSATKADGQAAKTQTSAQNATDTKAVDYAAPTNQETSQSLIKRIISHLAIDVYYTPEYVQSTLKVNNDYAGPASKNLNDYTNEETQYSYSTGLNLRYNIGSHWSIASGIQSSSYSKSAVYNSISVVADSVYQEVYVNRPWSNQSGGGGHHGGGHQGGGGHGGPGGGHGHPNPNPNPNPGGPGNPNDNHHYIIHTPSGSIDLNTLPPNANTSNSGDTLKVKTEVFETISFINIPFLVRYSFGTKKLSYFVEGGGALNYVQTEKVQVVINDATKENNSLDGLSTMNYSLLFGFGAQYNFYKGLSMFVKPSLRYSVTPINIDSPVESFPHYYGLTAGFTIHF